MKEIVSDSHLTLIDSDYTNSDLGARFRRARFGPECNLVESFLPVMPLDIPGGCRATVFREPRIESGFPDLVIVVWQEEVTRDWRIERRSLQTHDLRIMHFLHNMRRGHAEELVARFGRRALGSIERLSNAAMIRFVRDRWTPCELHHCFAASKIIAVEAKVGKWNQVLNQALLNTWFASKSYVLVPSSPSKAQIADAKRFGIGVCSFDDGEVVEVASASSKLPRSYASWIFNDLAWRYSQGVKINTQ